MGVDEGGSGGDERTALKTTLTTETIPNKGFPKHVFLIISNELCERFSFYGLRAILAIYFTDFFGYTEDQSTELVHAFIFVSYGCCLIGGYLSDSIWGKFRTILTLSLVYVLGGSCLSLSSVNAVVGTPPKPWLAFIALFLLALGSGGIKPCVSAFVGDQFTIGQERFLKSVFFIFYFSINLGSVVSTLVTPVIKQQFSFAAAFALPAVLLVVAVIFFVLGSPFYIRIPPSGSGYWSVIRGYWRALRAKWAASGWTLCCCCRRRSSAYQQQLDQEVHAHSRSNSNVHRASWIDYALETEGQQRVDELKALASVARVFVAIPVFWALFDQHSSRWVFQARKMNLLNGRVTESQVPAINPFLAILLIPTFNRLIYPGLARLGLDLKPLQRMTIGMVLAAASFVVTAILEMYIESQPPKTVSVAWQFPQYLIIGCSEVMISITGLEFAYSQAPPSLKGLIMAMWLVTVALGNIFVVVIASIALSNTVEFWFFGGVMLAFAGLFVLLTRGYQYRGYVAVEEVGADSDCEGDPSEHPSASSREPSRRGAGADAAIAAGFSAAAGPESLPMSKSSYSAIKQES